VKKESKEKEKPRKSVSKEAKVKTDESNHNNDTSKHSDEENDKDKKVKTPFEEGKDPEKIIGATEVNGELAFLVQWKGSNKAQLIPSKLARARCPQLVIDFYEQRLTWHAETEA